MSDGAPDTGDLLVFGGHGTRYLGTGASRCKISAPDRDRVGGHGAWPLAAARRTASKDLDLAALWHFINGHGVHEKTLAELKSGFADDQIPTRDLQANTAWQKLNLLAHNINVGLQVDTLPRPRRRTHKRTTSFVISSIRTVRFEWLNRAARPLAPAAAECFASPRISPSRLRSRRSSTPSIGPPRMSLQG